VRLVGPDKKLQSKACAAGQASSRGSWRGAMAPEAQPPPNPASATGLLKPRSRQELLAGDGICYCGWGRKGSFAAVTIGMGTQGKLRCGHDRDGDAREASLRSQ